MDSILITLVFVSSMTLLLACGRSPEGQDPLLREAANYHQQATAIQTIVEPKLERIDSLKATLRTQLTPAVTRRIATLDSLKLSFDAWEMNLVDVPGMPHDPAHDHGAHTHHHHTDAALKDLPAEQMRDLQREMLHNIRQIQSRLDTVMPTL